MIASRTLAAIVLLLGCNHSLAADFAPIKRTLPAQGIELKPEVRAKLAARVKSLRDDVGWQERELNADVEIYLKAVDFALKNNEFYDAKDAAKAEKLLDRAAERIDQLKQGKTPWTSAHGLVVRGFTSAIDHSAQPYGLVIPEKLALEKPVPLYVWLHGRGDKETDLHFIHQRETKVGQIAPVDAIVLHPFGRQCVGFKSAGEIDVLEAIEHVKEHYNIDPKRIVLMGFSMGGAGCWHLGAHYADRFVAMSPGAGFAETARYVKLKPENFPPKYEQQLWGAYDVPCYTRNLFNLPVIAYSGEKDGQIQAARVMEEAFKAEGRTLPHLIGPGMGHAYHPDTLKELMAKMKAARERKQDEPPKHISLQTRTLRYGKMHWVEITGLEKHWEDSRVEADLLDDNHAKLTTKNITRLKLSPSKNVSGLKIEIDADKLETPQFASLKSSVELAKVDGHWQFAEKQNDAALAKSPGLQGPIDDAFLAPFLVVTPTGTSQHPLVQKWADFELNHFRQRWREVFRGELREKKDSEVTPADIAKYNLILWGDADSNRLIAQLAGKLPLSWNEKEIIVGNEKYDAATHVPVMIYPNPLTGGAAKKYIVLNSGPTFREAHDRTNSQQNPKLPDWAVIDLSQPPSDSAPGRIAAAGFFDEAWQLPPADN